MTYTEALKLAYPIHDALYGEPKDHQQWADGFNKRGKIAEVLIKATNSQTDAQVSNTNSCADAG